jgi:hypothetical protein
LEVNKYAKKADFSHRHHQKLLCLRKSKIQMKILPTGTREKVETILR